MLIADVFSKNLVAKFLKYIGINNHIIKLVAGQLFSYTLIYSQKPVELEILKTYIETNLVNGFIKPSKPSISAHILFFKKPNSSF